MKRYPGNIGFLLALLDRCLFLIDSSGRYTSMPCLDKFVSALVSCCGLHCTHSHTACDLSDVTEKYVLEDCTEFTEGSFGFYCSKMHRNGRCDEQTTKIR